MKHQDVVEKLGRKASSHRKQVHSIYSLATSLRRPEEERRDNHESTDNVFIDTMARPS
jgi:hypothetical protein